MLTRLQLNIAPITLARENGIIQIVLSDGTSVVIKLNNKSDIEDVMTMVGSKDNTVLILRNTTVEFDKKNEEIEKLFGSITE
jgi:hypothetical protein